MGMGEFDIILRKPHEIIPTFNHQRRGVLMGIYDEGLELRGFNGDLMEIRGCDGGNDGIRSMIMDYHGI